LPKAFKEGDKMKIKNIHDHPIAISRKVTVGVGEEVEVEIPRKDLDYFLKKKMIEVIKNEGGKK